MIQIDLEKENDTENYVTFAHARHFIRRSVTCAAVLAWTAKDIDDGADIVGHAVNLPELKVVQAAPQHMIVVLNLEIDLVCLDFAGEWRAPIESILHCS